MNKSKYKNTRRLLTLESDGQFELSIYANALHEYFLSVSDSSYTKDNGFDSCSFFAPITYEQINQEEPLLLSELYLNTKDKMIFERSQMRMPFIIDNKVQYTATDRFIYVDDFKANVLPKISAEFMEKPMHILSLIKRANDELQ